MNPTNRINSINFEKLTEDLGGDQEALVEIICLFHDNLTSLWDQLNKSLKQKDSQGVRISSHTLKGHMKYFGFDGLASRFGLLEKMGQSGNLEGAQNNLSDLGTQIFEIDQQLMEWVNSQKSSLAAEQPASNDQVRILIIDDDEVSSRSMAIKLKKFGFESTVETDPKKALSHIRSEGFDSVLLDLIMPEIDGLTLLKTIRQEFDMNVLPIIILSGIDEMDAIQECLTLTANDYLVKPATPEMASTRIRAHCLAAKQRIKERQEIKNSALRAMIATYNHEINNPLTVAIAGLKKLEKISHTGEKLPLKYFDKITESLQRIAQIVKEIERLTRQKGGVHFDDYHDSHKMIKLK